MHDTDDRRATERRITTGDPRRTLLVRQRRRGFATRYRSPSHDLQSTTIAQCSSRSCGTATPRHTSSVHVRRRRRGAARRPRRGGRRLIAATAWAPTATPRRHACSATATPPTATEGRSPARARRRSLRRRTSSPRARPRCERGARPRLSWANTAPTSVAAHRRHPHPPRVRTGSRRRDPRALEREAHRRGLRRTRYATGGGGHEEDGVRGVSGQKTRSTCESSRQTQHRPGRGARGGEVWWWLSSRPGSFCRVSVAGDASRRGRSWPARPRPRRGRR